MDEKDIIAKNIIFHRKRLGLSQLELAEKLNYSNKNISKWEKGETLPSVFTLKRLSEIFGITLDELVSIPPENSKSVDTDDKKDKKPTPNFKKKFMFLLLSIAILYAVVFVSIFVLGLLNVTKFNYWLLFLYASPLASIAVMIFIKCTLKRIDYISLSLIGWLTALSVYLTFKNYTNISYVFFVALGYEFIAICIGVLVDIKYFHKIKQSKLIQKIKKHKKTDD